MSVSYWATRVAQESAASCEVAVIGAGVAGLGAALALQDAGVDALIIDQGQIGAGASGRNAGYLMRGAADNYAAAVRDWGRSTARYLWALSEANQAALMGRGASALSGCLRRPSCLLAVSEAEAAELRRSAELMREDGFDCELITQGDDVMWRHEPWPLALVNPRDFVCDPLQLVTMLGRQVKRPPLLGAEVFGMEAQGSGLTVRTARGFVNCQRVMVCTNAWTGQIISGLSRFITAHRAQMVALDASAIGVARMPKYAYYADHGSEYLRAYDERTLLLGGKRKLNVQAEQTSADHATSAIQTALERYAERVLGRPLPVVHRWSGTMGFSMDGLPIVGPVALPRASDLTDPGCDALAGADDRVWVCAGFTGHGMSLGFETARRAVSAMLKEAGGEAGVAPLSIRRFADVAREGGMKR